MGQSGRAQTVAVVSPQWGISGTASLLARQAQEQRAAGDGDMGEVPGHTLTHEEDMADADPERLRVTSLTRKPVNGKTLTAFEMEE